MEDPFEISPECRALSLLDDPTVKTIYIRGGPGTGKTRLLTHLIVELVDQNKNVFCILPNIECLQMFEEEMENTTRILQWAEDWIVKGERVKEVLGTVPTRKTNELILTEPLFPTARVLIAYFDIPQIYQYIRSQNFKHQAIVKDDCLDFRKNLVFKHFPNDILFISAFDEKQLTSRRTDNHAAYSIMRRNMNKRDTQEIVLFRSNRPHIFLEFINNEFYYNKMIGDIKKSTMKFLDTSRGMKGKITTSEREAEIVVQEVQKLIERNVKQENIAVITVVEQQVERIKELLPEDLKNIQIGLASSFRWKPQVENVVFSMSEDGRDNDSVCKLIHRGLPLVFTRSSQRLIFVANGLWLKKGWKKIGSNLYNHLMKNKNGQKAVEGSIFNEKGCFAIDLVE